MAGPAWKLIGALLLDWRDAGSNTDPIYDTTYPEVITSRTVHRRNAFGKDRSIWRAD
jgi:hypothetical protein